MSDSLQPHGLQHARLPCSSPAPGVCSNSCPSVQWCHATISSSVVPFSSCPQSVLASGSLPMSQFFTSDDQSVGVLASASVLPMNIQDWFPLRWTGLISLLSRGLSRVFSNKQQFFSAQLLYSPTLLTTKQNLRWEQKSYRVALDNHSLFFYCPLAALWPLLPYRKNERLKGTPLPLLSCKIKILFPHFSFNLSWPCLYKTLLFFHPQRMRKSQEM